LTRKGFLRATTHREFLEVSARLLAEGTHEKEVSLARRVQKGEGLKKKCLSCVRAVRLERDRQAPKMLLKMRETGRWSGPWITGL
jgi:hypothetical protein